MANLKRSNYLGLFFHNSEYIHVDQAHQDQRRQDKSKETENVLHNILYQFYMNVIKNQIGKNYSWMGWENGKALILILCKFMNIYLLPSKNRILILRQLSDQLIAKAEPNRKFDLFLSYIFVSLIIQRSFEWSRMQSSSSFWCLNLQ